MDETDEFAAAALLVVDMQRDFLDGSLPVPGAAGVMSNVNLWIEIFEDLERPIIYSMDWHPPETPHFDRWPAHCVAGTVGAEMHPGVIYEPIKMEKVYTVLKGLGEDDGYSVCSTPSEIFRVYDLVRRGRVEQFGSMGTLLMREHVETVYVVGVATEYCVRASVLDLLTLGQAVVVVIDAVAGVDSVTSHAALVEMEKAGALFMQDEQRVPGLDTMALAPV